MTAWMSRGLCAEEASSDQSIAEMFFPDPGGFRDAADAALGVLHTARENRRATT